MRRAGSASHAGWHLGPMPRGSPAGRPCRKRARASARGGEAQEVAHVLQRQHNMRNRLCSEKRAWNLRGPKHTGAPPSPGRVVPQVCPGGQPARRGARSGAKLTNVTCGSRVARMMSATLPGAPTSQQAGEAAGGGRRWLSRQFSRGTTALQACLPRSRRGKEAAGRGKARSAFLGCLSIMRPK